MSAKDLDRLGEAVGWQAWQPGGHQYGDRQQPSHTPQTPHSQSRASRSRPVFTSLCKHFDPRLPPRRPVCPKSAIRDSLAHSFVGTIVVCYGATLRGPSVRPGIAKQVGLHIQDGRTGSPTSYRGGSRSSTSPRRFAPATSFALSVAGAMERLRRDFLHLSFRREFARIAGVDCLTGGQGSEVNASFRSATGVACRRNLWPEAS